MISKKGGHGFETRESSRRSFLKTAGKIAIYTPPAVVLLMHPSKEAVASGTVRRMPRLRPTRRRPTRRRR